MYILFVMYMPPQRYISLIQPNGPRSVRPSRFIVADCHAEKNYILRQYFSSFERYCSWLSGRLLKEAWTLRSHKDAMEYDKKYDIYFAMLLENIELSRYNESLTVERNFP